MALLLSSKDVLRRAERLSSGPAMAAAASALSTSLLVRSMKAGGFRNVVALGGIGGGAYLHLKGRSELLRAVGTGMASGALWSLVIR